MNLSNYFKKFLNPEVPETPEEIEDAAEDETAVSDGGKAKGTIGTEIYAGYIDEEYLDELKGSKRAKQFDRARRSDSIIKMTLSSVKLPIKSASWTVELNENIPDDKMEIAEKQKKFFDYYFFEYLSFTKWLGEITTCTDFGYSLFEKVHKPILRHDEFGPHLVIDVPYRSQKTIERFFANEDGSLKRVDQEAVGDLGKFASMEGKFLLHFAPDQEGADFEGHALIRPMWGAFKRKTFFLKLLAAGLEKYAIPTPTATVPAGKEKSKEVSRMKQILSCYTGNQKSFILKPNGWDIDFNNINFDADKVRRAISEENLEIVNSALASFLLLGQTNSGSRAVSTDLSTFFYRSLQYIADHISEVITKNLMVELVKINFGEKLYCHIQCEQLSNDADEMLAKTLQILVSAKIITPDSELESFIREKYRLPFKLTEKQANDIVDRVDKGGDLEEEIENLGQRMTLAENKIKDKTQKLINTSTQKLQDLFKQELEVITSDIVDALVKAFKEKPVSEARSLAVDLTTKPTPKKYIDKVLDAFAEISERAEDLIREQSSREIRLSETKKRRRAKRRVSAKAKMLAHTQLQDAIKKIGLKYLALLEETQDPRTIQNDLIDTQLSYLNSQVTVAGAAIPATQIVNDTMIEVAEDEYEDEIESYTFVAEMDDRTTAICQKLNGVTFRPNDPDLNWARPPLHHNCRSFLSINFKGMDNPTPKTRSLSLTQKEQTSISLGEACCNTHQKEP